MVSEKLYEIILSVLSDEASEEEKSLLNQWRNESPENNDEFARLEKLYRASVTKQRSVPVDAEQAWNKVHSQTFGRKRKVQLRWLLRYAAVAVILLTIGFFLLKETFHETGEISLITFEDVEQPTLLLDNGERIALNEASFIKQQNDIVIENEAKDKLVYKPETAVKDEKVRMNHLLIPHGNTYQVILADGTRVWLNSESEFSYPNRFTNDRREVVLTGEAFFEVSKNEGKPFIVKTNGVEVEVLGTQFNVSCYKDEDKISTTLVEGSVSVRTQNGTKQVISPSEQYIYNRIDQTTLLETVNTEIFTSWLKGMYIFRNAPLSDIIKSLQRWHQFTVSYEDENMQSKRYTFEIDRNTSLDKILEVISFTSDIHLEREKTKVFISKKKGGKSL